MKGGAVLTTNRLHIDRIIRSRRKSLSIQIDDQGRVIVRAPRTATDRYIEELISKKRTWIEKKQRLVAERHENREYRDFRDGDRYLYLGTYYPLSIQSNHTRGSHLQLKQGRFLLDEKEHHRARELMIAWYRRQAKKTLTELVSRYACNTGLSYKKIRITGAQKRWGSCSSTGNLNFSYRIVMAPEDVISYVVVHELAHLCEQNHSRRFWELVEKIMPEYRKHRRWLREKGHLLSF